MEVRKSVSHLYEEQGKEETNNNNTASAISFREYVQIRTFPNTLSIGMLYINALSFGGP